MSRVLHLMAHLDAPHPRMRHHLVDRRPLLRVRVQHLPYQAPARLRAQVVDCWRACRYRRGRVRARCAIGLKERIRGGLRGSPGELLEVQAVVHNPTSPNIDQSCIICCIIGEGARHFGTWEQRGLQEEGWGSLLAYSCRGRNEEGINTRFPRNCSGAM